MKGATQKEPQTLLLFSNESFFHPHEITHRCLPLHPGFLRKEVCWDPNLSSQACTVCMLPTKLSACLPDFYVQWMSWETEPSFSCLQRQVLD